MKSRRARYESLHRISDMPDMSDSEKMYMEMIERSIELTVSKMKKNRHFTYSDDLFGPCELKSQESQKNLSSFETDQKEVCDAIRRGTSLLQEVHPEQCL